MPVSMPTTQQRLDSAETRLYRERHLSGGYYSQTRIRNVLRNSFNIRLSMASLRMELLQKSTLSSDNLQSKHFVTLE